MWLSLSLKLLLRASRKTSRANELLAKFGIVQNNAHMRMNMHVYQAECHQHVLRRVPRLKFRLTAGCNVLLPALGEGLVLLRRLLHHFLEEFQRPGLEGSSSAAERCGGPSFPCESKRNGENHEIVRFTRGLLI